MFSDESLTVYDKETGKHRPNQPITNIACQNRFYDFTKEEIDSLKNVIPNLTEQHIENFFSREIEGNLKACILTLQNDTYFKNQEFITKFSNDFKANIAVHMAYQFLRTKEIRKIMEKKYNSKLPHHLLLLDETTISDLALYFYNKKWNIRKINDDNISFYTSDNPIVIFNYENNTLSFEALATEGEKLIFYPLSDKILITLFDLHFSEEVQEKMPDFGEVELSFEADFPNSLQYRNATRCLFTSGEQIAEKCWDFINNKISDEVVDEGLNLFALIDELTNKSNDMNLKEFLSKTSIEWDKMGPEMRNLLKKM
jgi:hypothetical protein